MRKTKRILPILILLSFILGAMTLSVYAHSGKTDGSGGHTDHDTGEYHYHHGYPAHDHYDMDGDGDRDCPYDFDDKTDHSPGSNSGITAGNKPTISGDFTPEDTEKNSPIQEEAAKKVPGWIYWVIAIMAIIIVCLFIKIKWKNDDITQWEDRYRRDIQKEKELAAQRMTLLKEEHQKQMQTQKLTHDAVMMQKEQFVREGLQNLTSDLNYFISIRYLYNLSGAPDNEYIGECDLPKSADCSTHKWGEKYTFYTTLRPSASRAKFHRIGCKYCSFGHPINAYTIQQNIMMFTPCSVCNPQLPDTKWVDRYLEHKHFLDKHMGVGKSRIYNDRLSD